VILAALPASALLTGIVRRFALRHGMLDVPNARSSHVVATPRGGGVAVVCACLAAWLALYLLGHLSRDLLLALGGGVLVACIGYADDRQSLAVGVRLVAHFAAAAWALYCLGGLPPLQLGDAVYDLGIAGDLVATVGMVWVLNLFNFMDGIDGIAATEAVFIALAGAGFAWWQSRTGDVAPAALVLAAASAGFLMWNWPPARIFMGDAGSGFLGFTMAVLALAAAHRAPAALFTWLILGGAFFVDATVTIVRRMLRRVRVHDAHREHAYQRLSRRWHSHLKVVLVTAGINLCWLLPCAWIAEARPDYAALSCLLSLLLVALAAALVGAGKPE
jgi:Fuc2NAc and GlcNAc transferase